jgi:hypothetical protein
MATASRVFWESIFVLAFLAILAGVLFWSGGRVERHARSLTEQHEQALQAVDERHRGEIAALNQDRDRFAEEQAKERARAVFSAFEAGIHSAAAARWNRYLDSAKDSLLAQPAVLFVHLLTPQGRIISTSDDELARIGRLDEQGEWALGVDQLASRSGEPTGTLELAAPILEDGRVVAVLWMGFDLTATESQDSAS